MKSASFYRAEARELLKGRWGEAAILTLVLTVIIIFVTSPNLCASMILHCGWVGMALFSLPFVSLLLTLFVTFPFDYSYTLAFLKMKHGSEISLSDDMFAVLKASYGRAVGSYALISVYTFLIMIGCFLVFLIPTVGIAVVALLQTMPAGAEIADFIQDPEGGLITMSAVMLCCTYLPMLIVAIVWAYAVALVPYVVEEHPEMSVNDCIKHTCKMMKGHKWQLFCLDFSFIGWALLTILTLGIGLLWLQPYIAVSHAVFYDELVKKDEEPSAKEEQPLVEEVLPSAE